jgi:hypothetical protein
MTRAMRFASLTTSYAGFLRFTSREMVNPQRFVGCGEPAIRWGTTSFAVRNLVERHERELNITQ